MELTIARIISSKPVEGKFGPQFSIYFTTNELGDKGISTFSKYELKEGQKITGEVTEKPGEKKDGTPVVYTNFKFGKREGGGLSDGDKADIKRAKEEAYAARTEVQLIRQELEAAGVLKKRVATIPGTTKAYPDMEPKDITFDMPSQVNEEPPIDAFKEDEIPY